jgi:hypothetical protein
VEKPLDTATLATLLDRKVHYFLAPLVPGGLLLLCLLVGEAKLREAFLNSQGFGYIFRMSILVSMAWVLGGILFLVCFVLNAFFIGIVSRLSGRKSPTPWGLHLWRCTVTNTFGVELVAPGNDGEWKQLFRSLDTAFPDEGEAEGMVVATLLVSSAVSFVIGTAWWRDARLLILYVAALVVFALGILFAIVDDQKNEEDMAARQIGILLRHHMEVEKAKRESAGPV